MARLARILPNPHRSLPCETHHCSTRAQWILSQERGPLQLARRICTDDVANMVETLPDDFLPAVRDLVLRHVLEGTEFGTDLWERFRALQPGAETAGTTDTSLSGERETASPGAISGGTGAVPDPAVQLAGIEAIVLDHVTNGTEWGLALVAKIADAIPEEVPAKADPEMVTVQETRGQNGSFSLGVVNGDGSVTELSRGAPFAIFALTEGDGGEPPVNPDAEHACVCGWDPKPGSENPDRDLKAHQRFCKLLKGEKGDG